MHTCCLVLRTGFFFYFNRLLKVLEFKQRANTQRGWLQASWADGNLFKKTFLLDRRSTQQVYGPLPPPRLPRRTTLMTSAGVKVAISSTSSLWDKYSSTRLSSDTEDSCSEGVGEENLARWWYTFTMFTRSRHPLIPYFSHSLIIMLVPQRLITPHGYL